MTSIFFYTLGQELSELKRGLTWTSYWPACLIAVGYI